MLTGSESLLLSTMGTCVHAFSSVIARKTLKLLAALLHRWRPWIEKILTIMIMPTFIMLSLLSATIKHVWTGELSNQHITSRWTPPKNHRTLKQSDAISRTMTQIFHLLNDLPGSSFKYQFVKSLAEEVLVDNACNKPPLHSVNKTALAAAFIMTLRHLEAAVLLHLQGPSASLLGQLLESALSSIKAGAAVSEDTLDTMSAEKFGKQLLWIAEKMKESECLEEAACLWGRMEGSKLPALALCLGPRVRMSLMRLTVILVNAIGKGEICVPAEVRLHLIINWMPLLCKPACGADGPIFNHGERLELETSLSNAIFTLPPVDQELILCLWLQEYAWSAADWPNLHAAYSHFCDKARIAAAAALPQTPTLGPCKED